MTNDECLEIPTGLSRKGRAAAQAILKILKGNGTSESGGCKIFYSPKEWKNRGELYGLKSELIVVYDGGDLYHFLSYSSEAYKAQELMFKALENVGVYAEPCTCWYSAIY